MSTIVIVSSLMSPSIQTGTRAAGFEKNQEKNSHEERLTTPPIPHVEEEQALFTKFWILSEKTFPQNMILMRQSILLRAFRELPNMSNLEYKKQLLVWLQILEKEAEKLQKRLYATDLKSKTKKSLMAYSYNLTILVVGGLTGVIPTPNDGKTLIKYINSIKFILNHFYKIGKLMEKNNAFSLGQISSLLQKIKK